MVTVPVPSANAVVPFFIFADVRMDAGAFWFLAMGVNVVAEPAVVVSHLASFIRKWLSIPAVSVPSLKPALTRFTLNVTLAGAFSSINTSSVLAEEFDVA